MCHNRNGENHGDRVLGESMRYYISVGHTACAVWLRVFHSELENSTRHTVFVKFHWWQVVLSRVSVRTWVHETNVP